MASINNPILAVIILTVAFGACEKEEISYAFQEISAPTDVTAVFDITQDDTGVVTVTPSGEGAQEFQVYWGDVANEEPELVTPGGSLEHTYEEGQFKARVIAVGSTGLTSEFAQMLNVSFSAPENLEVTIDQSDPNPLLVKISASADNATMFDVFWGDVDDEEATPLMPNETVEHVYPAAGEYTVRVIAKGATGFQHGGQPPDHRIIQAVALIITEGIGQRAPALPHVTLQEAGQIAGYLQIMIIGGKGLSLSPTIAYF